MNLWNFAREALQHWTLKEYFESKVQKFIGKIINGFDFWFTFIVNPGVEPTSETAAAHPRSKLRGIRGAAA